LKNVVNVIFIYKIKFMEPIILRKINDGDTGAMAAKKIYSNDEELKKAISTIANLLDAYGTLISIEASGATISLEYGPGDSNTGVMTQKAVTDFVNNSVDGMCVLGQEIQGELEMPSTSDFVDAWVSRASANAQGNSLTVLWNDVQELKNLGQTISDLQDTVESLSARVTVLEQIVGGM